MGLGHLGQFTDENTESLITYYSTSLAVQWWFLFYFFINRGTQNYCEYQIVICSAEEVSVSGYEMGLSQTWLFYVFSNDWFEGAMWPDSGQFSVMGNL